uniref:Ankyrin-1 n=1 Tax=Magallana gigas TaxID=29159 RepID=K1QTQ8_MAGGI
MALSKYDSTRETTNLARIARAIFGPCTDVLHDILRKEITPQDLKKELKKYPDKYRISQHQKQVVNNGDYSKFDISLLYMFLRNLGSIPEHKNKWGTDPDPYDKSVSANIERIRNLRNEWGHSTDLSLSDSDFEKHWKIIFQNVKDLEGYLGATTVYQDALKNLKSCCMDPDSIQPYIKKLLWVEQLVTDLTDLKEEVKQIKKTIEPASLNESTVERIIFEQWEQDNNLFISTKACKKVEQLIKDQNAVIVAGHSGSGKSAIIQHIALKYRSQGWIVKPIYEVRELINYCLLIQIKTLFVLNDPIGKESFDEISHDAWRQNEEKLKALLKKVKVLMSCRKYILSDARIAGIFTNKSYIVDIDNNILKLNDDEKETIFKKHSFVNKFSKEEFAAIVKIDAYFPLLCKLYFSNATYQNDGLKFFKMPAVVLEEEIRNFRKASKEKYCALVLLVLFNNALCVNDFLQEETSKRKYKHALELCGMSENTAPYKIGDILESMEGFFVKKIGDNFHFYHDFVMEITTYVFGSDYPKETIEYADVSFLRRRVKLEDCKDENDKFSIVLSDKYIANLGKRLFMEIFGEHLLDVVLNPCMRNEKVRNIIIEELNRNPEKYKMLLEKKVLQIEKDEQYKETKDLFLSKLSFLNLRNEISPISAMIVFCHTELSLYCFKALKQLKTDIEDISLFSAVCCNGSLDLRDFFSNDHIKLYLKDTYACFHPIHLVSAFHNFEMMRQLIKFGVDVNLRQFGNNSNQDGCIPLIYAATANENNKEETSCETRRNETIKLLLSSGANVNQCKQNGSTPLHGACFYGLDSAVQLLLSNGANINLCKKDGAGPLYLACQNGHDSTVQLLLSNGADINLCNKNGYGPLSVACHNGHDSTVQLLLSNGANINLCNKNGYGPLYIACQNGHDSSVQLLLSNGANINSCMEGGAGPLYIACENGHNSTVQLLLSNGADINLCKIDGVGPLFIACENGHNSTVQLLLSNGADINSCMEGGAGPLYIACENGHDSTVQLLLSNGADINLCKKNGAGPLFIACQNGHDKIVQLLLSNGADINLCEKEGASPLYIACYKGHESVVQQLLSNGADFNKCFRNGASPLHISIQRGHNTIVQFLLNAGAD